MRVVDRLLDVASVIRKESLKSHGVLAELKILTHAQGTNWELSEEQAFELAKLVRARQTPQLPQYVDFGPAPKDDPKDLQKFARRVRNGQAVFRKTLLHLYDNKCAISGWCPKNVLQAAHIVDHAITGINHPDNGMLLRSDLHDLYDDQLLRIEPETLLIVIDESLKETSYWQLNGTVLRKRNDDSKPSTEFLKRRWTTAR